MQTVHHSGEILYLSKDKITHLWLCQIGTLEQTCMQNADRFPPSQGCEVLTTDCVCYRWEYAFRSALETKGFTVQVKADRHSPQCVVVAIIPSLDVPIPTHVVYNLKLTWEIASYEGIVPPILAYMLEKKYYTSGQSRNVPFFYYRQAMLKNICPTSPEGAMGIDLACTTVHNLPFLFLDKAVKTSIDEYTAGIQFFLLLGGPIFATSLIYYFAIRPHAGVIEAGFKKNDSEVVFAVRYQQPHSEDQQKREGGELLPLEGPRKRVQVNW